MKIFIFILTSVAAFTATDAMARKVGQTRDQAIAASARKFLKIDGDSDGKISQAEFSVYAIKVGRKSDKEVIQVKVDRQFRRIDVDGNGMITATELQAYDLARFDKADTNRNGVIDPAEAS